MSSVTLSVSEAEAFLVGQPVFHGDMPALIDEIARLVTTGSTHLLVTANIDHVIDLYDGSPLNKAYRAASLRTIDGTPLLWTLRSMGARGLNRLTGADLMTEVCAASEARGWKVAIAGGNPQTLHSAARNLRALFPDATISAVPMPMLKNEDDARSCVVIAALEKFNPDVTFLCLGAPKQELWYLRWQDELPAGVYIGAGAAVDFAAGSKKRAPRWAQAGGLEWLWRVAQESRRLAPRYFIKGPRFIEIVAKSLNSNRR